MSDRLSELEPIPPFRRRTTAAGRSIQPSSPDCDEEERHSGGCYHHSTRDGPARRGSNRRRLDWGSLIVESHGALQVSAVWACRRLVRNGPCAFAAFPQRHADDDTERIVERPPDGAWGPLRGGQNAPSSCSDRVLRSADQERGRSRSAGMRSPMPGAPQPPAAACEPPRWRGGPGSPSCVESIATVDTTVRRGQGCLGASGVIAPWAAGGWSLACWTGAGRWPPPPNGFRLMPRRSVSGATDSLLRVMPGCGTGRAGPVVHRTARLRRSAGGCSSCVGSAVGVRPISGSRSAWPLRRCRRSSTLRVWDALTRVIGPPTPQSCQRSGISVNAPAS